MKPGEKFNPYRQFFNNALIPEGVIASKLSRGAAILYGILRRYAGPTGQAWPRQTRLARDMSLTERSIRRLLSELRTAGLITIAGREGARRGKTYSFLWNSCYFGVDVSEAHRTEMSGLTGQKCPVLPYIERISEEGQLVVGREDEQELEAVGIVEIPTTAGLQLPLWETPCHVELAAEGIALPAEITDVALPDGGGMVGYPPEGDATERAYWANVIEKAAAKLEGGLKFRAFGQRTPPMKGLSL